MQNAPLAANTQPAKKNRGCVVALALFAVGAILVGGTGLGLAWHFGYLEKIGRGAKLAYDATNAPGTSELRTAGCDQAMVMNTDDLAPLVGKTGPHTEKLIVTCIGRSTNVPTCDDAASAYVRAVGTATAPFVVTVRKTDGKADRCIERYATDGTRAN